MTGRCWRAAAGRLLLGFAQDQGQGSPRWRRGLWLIGKRKARGKRRRWPSCGRRWWSWRRARCGSWRRRCGVVVVVASGRQDSGGGAGGGPSGSGAGAGCRSFGLRRDERAAVRVRRTDALRGPGAVADGDGAGHGRGGDGALRVRGLREERASAVGSRRGGWTTCWRRCASPAPAPRTRQGDPLLVRATGPDALLRRVPLARPADRFGARRGGLQDGGGAAHEMHRHALDGGPAPTPCSGCAAPA